MPFGLGLGILFLSLYEGRSASQFSLLTGQIVSVQNDQLGLLIAMSAVALIALVLMWRPLRFDSLDPVSAAARGVPTTAVSLGFLLVLGLIVAVSVHIIGALLVMALLVTPAAAAMRVASGPVSVPLLSALFGFTAAVGGILLAIAGTLPVSPYITTFSFLIYVVCRLIGARRGRVEKARLTASAHSWMPQPLRRLTWAARRIAAMVVQRNTWQRERVREALADARGFVSAQSLHATLRDENTGIGLATVYRALAGLAAQGAADSLQSPDGESLYRACATRGHHHHLICRSCGVAVEIEATDVEQWARRTAAANGFIEAEHIVDIFGLCAACAAARASERDAH